MFLSITKTHLKLSRVGVTLHLLLFILSYPAQIGPEAWHPYPNFAVKLVLSYTEILSPTCTWSPQARGCEGPAGTKRVSHCTEINGSHGRKITTSGTLRCTFL